MRKLMVFLLALIFVVAFFAGCDQTPAENVETATQSETEGSAEQPNNEEEAAPAMEVEPFKIAVNLFESGSVTDVLYANNTKKQVELVGGEVVFGGLELTPDGCISFVESQIAAGANGLYIIPPADSVLPTVMTLCEEAGVYWGIAFRSIMDETIRAQVEASPYYVGNCYENEVESGYNVMKYLNEQGMKNVAIISTVKGDATGDQREQGIAQACEELGMEVVAEARGLTQASDVSSATESFLSSFSNLDAVFVVATTADGAQGAVVKAIQDAGRADDVKLASIDFEDTMVDLFDSGVLVITYGLPHLCYDPFMTQVKIINACIGTPLSDNAFSTSMKMFSITNKDVAERWKEKFGDENTMYYSDEEMLQMYKVNNPELDEAGFQKLVDEFDPVR